MIFGASQDVSGLPPSRPEVETTLQMQKAWAAFAENPSKGLSESIGWPEFNPNGESVPMKILQHCVCSFMASESLAESAVADTLVCLAFNNSPIPDFVPPSVYDAPCSTITLGGLPTAS